MPLDGCARRLGWRRPSRKTQLRGRRTVSSPREQSFLRAGAPIAAFLGRLLSASHELRGLLNVAGEFHPFHPFARARQAGVSSARINASMSGQLTFLLLVEQLATNA